MGSMLTQWAVLTTVSYTHLFAYRIHSDVGDKTVQAIVNDTSVPLNYELQNNDIVKIRTNPSGTPSKEWLNFVKTSHAKNKIKSYFSKQDKENYTEKGKNILTSEIRKRKLSIDQVLSAENVKKICEDLKLETLEDIYFSIGSLRYTASVSYTHLDVYKRQLWIYVSIFKRSVRKRICYDRKYTKSYNQNIFTRRGLIHRVHPVSYTHLFPPVIVQMYMSKLAMKSMISMAIFIKTRFQIEQ